VSQDLAQNNAYLVSLDPGPDGSTFNVVMSAYPGGFSWWWYYGETEASLKTFDNRQRGTHLRP
jgi:hypothetical protein